MRKTTYPHELIGEEIEVVEATNKSNLGIKGKIVDETKETIIIEDESKSKTLLKKNIIFKLIKSGKIIAGTEVAKRPEDRIKG